jgi:glycosyltransferase involved in cell wall biosynthesis
MGIRNPRYRVWRRIIPWLRYGYTPHLVPWLKENAKRYDAIVVHGLRNYVALGLLARARQRANTLFCLCPWHARPLQAFAKQIFWWFSEAASSRTRGMCFSRPNGSAGSRANPFWPFRCRERVVAFGTKDVAGSADAQIAAFRALLPQLAGREFLLFLSRIHPKKGCDLLIRAFATAAAEKRSSSWSWRVPIRLDGKATDEEFTGRAC